MSGAGRFGSNISKIPSFIVKTARKLPHLKDGFFHVSMLLLLLSYLCLFLPWVFFSPSAP